MKIRPITDWILVKPIVEGADEDGFRKSEGGIVLLPKARPDTALMGIDREKQTEDLTAEVIAVGPGKVMPNGRNEGMWGIEPGDVVLHSPNGCPFFEFEGQFYRMVRRDSVVGYAN
jgi:co-chaperonin GroES (HSP10)